MQNAVIEAFEQQSKAPNVKEIATFRPGDTVRVQYKLQEGSDKSKFRIQAFEGVVIRLKKGTHNSTFTVRKMAAGGVGVERVFPFESPLIDGVEVKSLGRVRRSRLYYLRGRSGKSARIKSRYVARKKKA